MNSLLMRACLLIALCTSSASAQQPPDSVRALADARRLANDRDTWPQAARAFDALLLRAPRFVEAWVNRAEFDYDRDSLAAARRHVERALAVEPRLATALVMRGKLIGRSNIEQARADFRAAAAADPSSPEPPYHIGLTYIWQDDRATARTWFMEALRRNPQYFDARMGIEVTTSMRDRVAVIGRLLAERPSVALYRWRLALPDSVWPPQLRLKDLDGILALTPDKAAPAALQAQYDRAQIFARLRQNDAAADAYTAVLTAVAARPDSLGADGRNIMTGAIMRRAFARADQADYRAAVADFRLADRIGGPGTSERIATQLDRSRIAVLAEQVARGDASAVRDVATALLDTVVYRRIRERAAAGVGKSLMAELASSARTYPKERPLPLGVSLLQLAIGAGLDARADVAGGAAGVFGALQAGAAISDPRQQEAYRAMANDLLAEYLVRDLGLPVGVTYMCGRARRVTMAFQRATYEEMSAKRYPRISWASVTSSGQPTRGDWGYDPDKRELYVSVAGRPMQAFKVSQKKLVRAGQTLGVCR